MSENITKVTCITDNYPDGQKIIAAKVEYGREIDASSLNCDSFEVSGRKIRSVSAQGESVTIGLDPDDKAAYIIPQPEPFKPGKGPGGPGGPGGLPPKGPPKLPEAFRLPREVKVVQRGDIRAVDGSMISGSGKVHVSSGAVEPVIEDFRQFQFKGLGYNLYEPKTLEPGKKYPLVVFIHDAGPCGNDTRITLSQGNGAVSWASPEWQSKNPCYVLAPQIPRNVKLTGDNFHASEEIYILKEMIDSVADSCSVDKNRIYATGQSMGCMAFCELNILFPDYFAATLLVAGQWSPERMAESCTACKFWILVSNHDERAFPGMNAVTEHLERAGAKIGRYMWNAKSSQEQFDAFVAEALKDDVNIRYTVFEGSSVVPDNQDDNPATNHIYTWPVVYSIPALKRWLFSNSK